MFPDHLSPDREAVFPNLRREEYHLTSEEDWAYNCIAHAAGKNNVPWWPVDEGTDGVFWPHGVPREETLDAFIAAYGKEGFAPCDNPELEPGFEKIAIYADDDGTPLHAARQLPSGAWSSKLGDWEDIEHKTLASLEGSNSAYGKASRYLSRRISQPTPQPEASPPIDQPPIDPPLAAR